MIVRIELRNRATECRRCDDATGLALGGILGARFAAHHTSHHPVRALAKHLLRREARLERLDPAPPEDVAAERDRDLRVAREEEPRLRRAARVDAYLAGIKYIRNLRHRAWRHRRAVYRRRARRARRCHGRHRLHLRPRQPRAVCRHCRCNHRKLDNGILPLVFFVASGGHA